MMFTAVQGAVLGTDAAERAAVRELLRSLRVLALTGDEPDLDLVVGVDANDAVAVASPDGSVVPGLLRIDLEGRILEVVPGRVVLLADPVTQEQGDDAPEDVEDVEEDTDTDVEDAEDLEPAWVSAGGSAEDIELRTSLVVSTRPIEDVVMDAVGHGPITLVRAQAPAAWVREQPAATFGWELPTTLVVDVVGATPTLDLTGEATDRRWTPGALTAVALPDVDVLDGEPAQFLEEVLGTTSIARMIAEAFGVDASHVFAALTAPGPQQVDALVAALGLPAELGDVLRRTRTADSVPGVREIAPAGPLEAVMDVIALELDGPGEHGGWRGAYRTAAVERPWILRAIAAGEAGLGALLSARALRAGVRGDGGRGAALQGVFGALLLLDAAGEVLLQEGVRKRVTPRDARD